MNTPDVSTRSCILLLPFSWQTPSLMIKSHSHALSRWSRLPSHLPIITQHLSQTNATADGNQKKLLYILINCHSWWQPKKKHKQKLYILIWQKSQDMSNFLCFSRVFFPHPNVKRGSRTASGPPAGTSCCTWEGNLQTEWRFVAGKKGWTGDWCS